MEFIWYFIASSLAGISTGLAGLSAATIMVPIFIVLCPSFYGESGAYHATAIALASDIFGSLFTSLIYIKHKNIDMKKGWIMFVCIISMCILGSIVAFYAGNVVLGSFSLFLTFFIGIRFLIKPDTSKKDGIATSTKLNVKQIIISLFFGLTIGFGSGFVGSGGGMMMLVVFTAFLGMDLKKAVGTSTFIMTFTALIAALSHIIIDPSIWFVHVDVLIFCMITTTITSIIAAQFANKVNNKVVGLCCGVVLTILGAIMLILHYQIKIPLLEIATCFMYYFAYLISCIILVLILKALFKIPSELWRKMLHVIAYTSIVFMIYIANNALITSICSAIFAIIVYPILALFEHLDGFSNFFVERKKGEIKKSLLILFLSQALLVFIGSYLFKQDYIVITAILTWGCGDAAAALIGKKYGNHKILLPLVDQKKSYEGYIANFIVSFIVSFTIIILLTPYHLITCLLIAILAAFTSATSEVLSHQGNDTMIVPYSIATVLLLIHFII